MRRFLNIAVTILLISHLPTIGSLMNSPELLAEGESPVTPISVTVKAPFPIEEKLQERLVQITKDLIRKNLSDILIKSSSLNAETSIIRETAKGYILETLVMSLFRETYTAQMSRIEFVYENEEVTIRSLEPSFQPK